MKKSKVIINSLIEKMNADAENHQRELRELKSYNLQQKTEAQKKINELYAIIFIYQQGSRSGFLDRIFESIQHFKDSGSARDHEELEILLDILNERVASYSELKHGDDTSERDLHKKAKEALEAAIYE